MFINHGHHEGESFLNISTSLMPVEHLQMNTLTTDVFRRDGVTTIGDLADSLQTIDCHDQHYSRASKVLKRILQVTTGETTDWYAFWKMQDFVFTYRMLACVELDDLALKRPDISVGKHNFGNAGAMLARAGIDTIGTLISELREGLPHIPGMGIKKFSEMTDTLMSLVQQLRSGERSSALLALDSSSAEINQVVATTPEAFPLHEKSRAMGIGILHLGAKTQVLRRHGLTFVGDVAARFPDGLLMLDGLGRTTVAAVANSMEALVASQTDQGEVDWDKFTSILEVPLLPADRDPRDGNEFVAMVGETISAMGEVLEDPVIQLIISERLSKLPHHRASLEDVGSAKGINLTRERIRQREERFLLSLAAALVRDDYSGLNLHFRPGFSAWWKLAAERFAEVDEVDFDTLITGLMNAWSVERAILVEHFPFIATVITGDVPAGTTLGDAARLDGRILDAGPEIRGIPLKRLQLGRSAHMLARHGVDTVGSLVDCIRLRTVTRNSGSHFRNAIEHLGELASCIKEGGQVDWQSYVTKTGVPQLPASPGLGYGDFVRQIIPSVLEILEHSAPRSRSSQIYSLRTSRPLSTRLTMEETAKRLGTFGPSVKMEETQTLRFLNMLLIGRDYARAGAELNDGYLNKWAEAAQIFDEVGGDADRFAAILTTNWAVARRTLEIAMPTFVAVLTGYPHGRLTRHSRLRPETTKVDAVLPKVNSPQADQPGKIILRGFRRLH